MSSNKIRKLDETLINRIAAGEVVVRPCSAIKELIENSLDASSHQIHVYVKQGGLKRIEIRDDGCGILKDDLPLLCERFATSKLSSVDDLYQLNTYGFRGEALASLSYASHLTVITKVKDSPCAYTCTYEDGKIKNQVKPCAGTNGTTLIVEDLFYNNSLRLKMMKSLDEYHRIVDCVQKLALRNTHVSFQLKHDQQLDCDILTLPSTTLYQNMKQLYGPEIVRDMYDITISKHALYLFECKAYFTGTNYSSSSSSKSQAIFILFINGRLVDCQPLKKQILSMYALYVSKSTLPFVYVDLQMEPSTLDVNIHPSKSEVRFLNSEQIIQIIVKQIEDVLVQKSAKHSTTQLTLTVTPHSLALTPPTTTNSPTVSKTSKKSSIKKLQTSASSDPSQTYLDPRKMIRTDSRDQTLDKLKYHRSTSSSSKKTDDTEENEYQSPLAQIQFDRQIKLSSILELKQSIDDVCDQILEDIIKEFVYVGACDHKYSLIQYQTQLYLCDTRQLSQELFYQLSIYHFGNMGTIKLEQQPKIEELIRF
ncbi:unnamed protein product, partial [Didymodactylos carnosus]